MNQKTTEKRKRDFSRLLVPIKIDSDEWGCVVDYVSSHYDDIEDDVNDFGTLKPILKFMNRNCQ